MEQTLFGSGGLQTVAVTVGCSSGCSILGITKLTPPPTLLDVAADLLLSVVAAAAAVALFLPFLATDITLVALSAFF